MADWTLAVEAVPSGLSAVAIEDEQCVPIEDEDLVDGDVEVLTRSFIALAGTRESAPEHVLMVVPGDVSPERFAALADAASLAGLPDPSWLPDVVACAGETLAAWASGTPAVVVDARTSDLPVWPVRTADDGIQIAASGSLDVGARLDDLLGGVVQAKLSIAAPALAETLRSRRDTEARRDAAHFVHELRHARRRLVEADGEELVIATSGPEVSIGREEFVRLVDHALHDVLESAGRADVAVVIVTADRTPIVEHLVASTAGTAVDSGPDSSLRGAAALARPRHLEPEPTPGPDPITPESTTAIAVIPAPRRPERRPRWAVPALSVMLALAMSGAATVLVVGPSRVAGIVPVVSEQVQPAPVAPVGLGRK